MKITKEFLQNELKEFERQHRRAVETACATQAAIDVVTALLERLELPEEDTKQD